MRAGKPGTGLVADTLALRVARSGTKLPASQRQFIGWPPLSLLGCKLRTGGSSRSATSPAPGFPTIVRLSREPAHTPKSRGDPLDDGNLQKKDAAVR